MHLAAELVDLLAAHVPAYRPSDDPRRWLFEGDGGNPLQQNTVGYWWRKTCRDAGVDGLKLHDLRHYFAGGLIAQGCDVVMVQRAMGHGSATVTLATYSHLWPSAADKTRAAAAALMVETLADPVRTGAPLQAV